MRAGLKRGCFPFGDAPRQHDRRGPAVRPFLHPSVGGRHVCSYLQRICPRRILRPWLLRGMLALICCIGIAGAQVQLPEVLVRGAKPKPKPAAAARVRAAPAPRRAPRRGRRRRSGSPPRPPLSTRASTPSTRRRARRRQRSATTRSRRCRKARTPRSRRSCSGFLELPRIRPPAAISTSATSMPMCRPASTASCFRTASAASAPSSIPR